MDPILVKKSLEVCPISQKWQINGKISHLSGRKTLRNESVTWQFARTFKSAVFFEEEKSFDMGRDFRPWAANPIKKLFKCNPPPVPRVLSFMGGNHWKMRYRTGMCSPKEPAFSCPPGHSQDPILAFFSSQDPSFNTNLITNPDHKFL